MIILAASGCTPGDVLCSIGETVQGWASGVVENFVTSVAEGTMSTLQVVQSFWIYLPSPDVNSSSITTIQNNLAWYAYAFAVLGFLIAVGKMLVSGDFKGGAPGIKMIVNLILVTGVYTTAVALFLKAGDAFAPWIIEKATGEEMNLTSLMSVTLFQTTGVGPAFLLVLIAFLGGIANAIFMLVRSAMIALLVTFLPILAASSASETGQQAWNKANGYLISFLLYKPVAAVIFALGILQVRNPPPIVNLDQVGQSIYSVAVGVTTLLMAALALPALIKFIVPVAANGTSMAFSGGAVAAGGVAAGAAVVTLGATAATGGAAAGAGAAAATTSGTSAAAATGGAATSGAASAASGGRALSPAASGGGGDAAPQGGSGANSSAGGSASGGNSDGRLRDSAQVLNSVSAAAGSTGRGADDLAEEN